MNKIKMLSGKRLLAMLLCCLMVLALVPVQAQAYTAEVGVPYFDFSYESDGTEIMYHNSFELGGYTAGDQAGDGNGQGPDIPESAGQQKNQADAY